MNSLRGEVGLEIGGQTHRLCLTLGALAEIEAALGCRSIEEMRARLAKMSASDLKNVLAALLRGGGEDAAADRVATLPLAPVAAARAVADAFSAALAD